MPVDHSKDHMQHVHGADGAPPASLSDHLGQDLQMAKDKAAEYVKKGSNVVRNLTGQREIGKLFQGEE